VDENMIKLFFPMFLATIYSCSSEKSSEVESGHTRDPEESSSPNQETISTGSSSLSDSFRTLGCASSTCHGPGGTRKFSLTHDSSGNPVTDLSTSKRSLTSWTSWIRAGAKPPMPTYTREQYSEEELQHDYRILTGRDQ